MKLNADLAARCLEPTGVLAPAARGDSGRLLDVSLPWPPSVNHYWRHVGRRVLVSREGRAYRRLVEGRLAGCSAATGPLAVFVYAGPPDRRRRAVDDVLKALLDALQHAGAYHDDCQITDLTIRRQGVCAGGVVRVVTEAAGGGVLWPRFD